MRKLIERVVQAAGFPVTTCATIQDAQKQIETNPFLALVIADRRLPDGDGWELVKSLQKERRVLAAILITGYPVDLESVTPDDPILLKPFAIRALVRFVAAALSDCEG